MKSIRRIFSIAALALCALSMSYATTYFVNASAGNNANSGTVSGTAFKTITHAISVATSTDVINVAAGTYNTALGEVFPLVMVSGVTLTGSAGAATTIIDATGDSSRVFICDGNSASTIIQGFTITGGFSINYSSAGQVAKGGGIYITNNSQTIIQNNIITRNTARGYDFFMAGAGAINGGSCYGGGVFVNSGSPTIQNNVISYNVAKGGGGQDFRGGWSGNGSSGGDAEGGGIHAGFGGSGVSTLINNTFYGNQAIGGRGGSSNSLNAGNGGNATAGALDAGSDAIVRNNIFCNDSAIAGIHGGGAGGTNGTETDGALTSYTAGNLSYNLYYNNSAATNPNGATLGSNNILSDPLFISATNFHLQAASPARKAGTVAGAPTTDFDGTARTNPPAIGAYDGSVPSSVDVGEIVAPKVFKLAQNYPNPFNPSTTIEYSLAAAEVVSLRVYDVLGREVATLVNAREESGNHAVRLDGSELSSGNYYYIFRAGSVMLTKQMLLLK